jgi:CcmD family protein
MSDNLGYLLAAFGLTWVGIAVYVFYVSQQVSGLRQEMDDLEAREPGRSEPSG